MRVKQMNAKLAVDLAVARTRYVNGRILLKELVDILERIAERDVSEANAFDEARYMKNKAKDALGLVKRAKEWR